MKSQKTNHLCRVAALIAALGMSMPVVAVESLCQVKTSPNPVAPSGPYSAPKSEAVFGNLIVSPAVKPSIAGALKLRHHRCAITLTDAKGAPIQLRGMSTHGLQWFPHIINKNAFAALSRDWGSNLVRLALYVGEGGYASKPELLQKVVEGIDLAIANDMYVMVDWHVLSPGDPNADVYKGAMDFFKAISRKYPNNKHIIYELANEPNSGQQPGVSNNREGWLRVKAYAEPIIGMLRKSGNENLIIVGTPNWSQRPDLAVADPIRDDNVMYALHFYSGSHGPSNDAGNRTNVMSNARYALENGVGVFVTEWGTSLSNGDDGPYLQDADVWLDFMNKHNLSWANWAMANKPETSGAFTPGAAPAVALDPGADQKWDSLQLSLSGEYARSRIKGIPYVPVPRTAP